MASAELRQIRRRIRSVQSTMKITRAMELIASSRIVKAQQSDCVAAGPTGGGVCGSTCDVYCHEAAERCAPDPSCTDSCPAWADGLAECRLDRALAGDCDATICDEAAPTCSDYCALVTAECPGEYTTEGSCLDFCKTTAALPAGLAGETSGNTIGCRMTRAKEGDCAAAGPFGDGVCGTQCEVLCHIASSTCPGALPTCAAECAGYLPSSLACRLEAIAASDCAMTACTDQPPEPATCNGYCSAVAGGCPEAYASEGACLDFCKTAAQLPLGLVGDTSGNTVGCRQHWAGEGDCAAAGKDGGGVCGAACDTYCHVSALDCMLYTSESQCQNACALLDDVACRIDAVATGDCAQVACEDTPDPMPSCAEYCAEMATHCPDTYSNSAACLAFCTTQAKLPLGAVGAVVGNSVGCRTTHALADNCGAAGPSGGNTCGTWCESYCHLADVGCTGANQLYDTAGACQTACAAMSTDGADGDATGDNVHCRIAALIKATDDPAGGSQALHCKSAAPDGGVVCVAPGGPGDTCGSAYVIDGVPYSGDSDPKTAKDNYAGCGLGDGVKDEVYTFTASEPGNFTVTVSGGAAAVAILDGCGGGCLDSGSSATIKLGPGDAVTIVVEADAPYNLTVNGAPDCESYCAAVTDACNGGYAGYVNEAACLQYCETTAAIPPGLLGQAGGNTIGCRAFHASLAADDPAGHCAAAGPLGGSVCGSWCENYCHLALSKCTGPDALFFNESECLSKCKPLAYNGHALATTGNSVQCRMNAIASGNCASGAVSGGATCTGPEGDTCGDAFTIDTLPYVSAADTTAAGSDYGYGTAGNSFCPGPISGWGGKSNDHAYVLTAPITGTYRFDLTPANTFDTTLYAALDCADFQNTCLVADEQLGDGVGESIDVELTKGQTAYVIVDGFSKVNNNPKGAYVLTGDLLGNSCQSAVTIPSIPYEHSASTKDFPAAVAFATGSCPGGAVGYGHLSSDRVYTYQAKSSGVFDIKLTTTAFDASVYVVTDCVDPDHHCVGAADTPCTDCTETLSVLLSAGQRYYVVVDGSSPGANVSGDYTLTIEQASLVTPTCDDYCEKLTANCVGPDAQYDSKAACVTFCADTVSLPAGTSADLTQNTIGCRAYYAALSEQSSTHCDAAGPTGGGVCGDWCEAYCLIATARCAGLYPNYSQCLGACVELDNGGSPGDLFGDTVQCRVSWLLPPSLAEGACDNAAPDGGDACTDPDQGDVCADPFVIATIPFAASNDTTGAGADYSFAAGQCAGEPDAGFGLASADHVYVYTPLKNKPLQVKLEGLAGAVYVVSDCSAIGNSCLAADHAAGAGASLDITMLAGETYYIVVDGASNVANTTGPYTLTVDDVGASCATPFVVDEVPFTAQSTTVGASNNYLIEAGACPGAPNAEGGGSSDHAYRFTAPADGVYEIKVQGYDATLYVVTDCANVSSTCLGGSQLEGDSAPEVLNLSLTAGETVFVIVDGWKNGLNEAGPYTLTIK